MSAVPALELRVCVRDADGAVRLRERWRWTTAPPAGQVLQRLARAALLARRTGCTLHLEDGPAELRALLDLHGVGGQLAR